MASSIATGSGMVPDTTSAVKRDVEIVELVVEVVDGRGGAGRPLGEGVARAPPDGGRHLAHALDQAAAAGRHLGPQAPGGPPGDVLGQVAVALHVGQHPQDRHHLAPLVGGGLPVHQLLLDRA